MKTSVTASVAGLSGGASETASEMGFFGGAGIDYLASSQLKVTVAAKMPVMLTEGWVSMYFNVGVRLGLIQAGR